MPYGPEDSKIEAALDACHLILEFAGLIFPPVGAIANDVQAAKDLYTFLSLHTKTKPGEALLPGPRLIVRNPAKF